MLIVNLTTTFQRLDLCRITLTSLLLQSKHPDRINLWVSKEPYLRDAGIADDELIEKLIESLPERGRECLSVRWVRNIGPYRKLIPILREAAESDVIVTADDDIFYSKTWLDGLVNVFKEADGNPVAARVRAKRNNFFGKKTSYLHWPIISQRSLVSENFVVTFGGGAVVTKSMFRNQDIVDDSFEHIAATTDDLWYSKLLELGGNKIVVVPKILSSLNFIHHNDGLINNNYPSAVSVFQKLRFRTWDHFFGFLGFPVCVNDMASNNIDKYFAGE